MIVYMNPNPSPQPTQSGTHASAPESAEPLTWCIREDYAGAGKYYPHYETANLGKYVFAVRTRRSDSRKVLLVRVQAQRGTEPVARFECPTEKDAKARAEKFAADNDLHLT